MSLTMDAHQSLLNTIALRPLNWQLCQAVKYGIWCCTEIEVDIRWPTNRFSTAKAVVFIQKTEMHDFDKAVEFLGYICANARVITKFKMNVEVSDTQMADALFAAVLNGKKVELEEIRVRRRYVGQQFPMLVELIKNHSSSLRVIGKLGLGEAIHAFNDQIHLERFSLINFDLIENGEMESDMLAEKTRFAMRRLAGLGATFDHLSYTTFSGFDLTKNPAMHMLKMCEVKSIRLTQQKGVAISDPAVIRPLLPGLTRIELIGCMEVRAKSLEALFPNLDAFYVQKQDLVTGGAAHSRNLRPVPEVNRMHESMNLHFPIAAAC